MYYYIVNPAAGGGRINKIQDRLKERLKRLGIMGEFVKSTGSGDVAKLARIGIEKGYKTIIAVGGDGTINEVMNVAIGNEKVAMGIIPTSNTNNLAFALGIKDWYSATGILASRKIEQIDLGKVSDRYFVTSVTIGFDPKIAGLNYLANGNIIEKTRFSAKVFKEAASFKPVVATLKFDNNYEVEADCFNIIISNSQFFPFRAIKTKPQDNLLDTVVIAKVPPAKIIKYSLMKDNSAIDLPKISVFHSSKIEINTKDPADVSVDGQIAAKTPVKIEIAKEKIKMIVSRKRKF